MYVDDFYFWCVLFGIIFVLLDYIMLVMFDVIIRCYYCCDDSILSLYIYMVFGGLLISASFIGMIFISIRLNPIYYETSIKCCILLNIIFMSYFLFVNELLVLWSNIIQLNSYIYSFWFSSISSSFIILVLFVSFSVIISCIGYLSIKESVICLVYIYMFIMVMLHFIGLNNILLSFIVWDWLGIISFACIHFWSSKIRSGIKAVIYNKIGDCLYYRRRLLSFWECVVLLGCVGISGGLLYVGALEIVIQCNTYLFSFYFRIIYIEIFRI